MAFLDLETPRLDEVLGWLSNRHVIVVPMLLTPAYHARVDVPTVVAAARDRGARIDVTPILGAPHDGGTDLLVAALRRRLHVEPTGSSAIVLAAAGSRDPRALAAVEAVAEALGRATGRPCRAGYASGIGASVADVVADLHRAGADEVVLASHFLAPGVLHDRAMLPSRPAVPAPMAANLPAGRTRAVDLLDRGAFPKPRVVATDPLGAAAEITELVLRRIEAAPRP